MNDGCLALAQGSSPESYIYTLRICGPSRVGWLRLQVFWKLWWKDHRTAAEADMIVKVFGFTFFGAPLPASPQCRAGSRFYLRPFSLGFLHLQGARSDERVVWVLFSWAGRRLNRRACLGACA